MDGEEGDLLHGDQQDFLLEAQEGGEREGEGGQVACAAHPGQEGVKLQTMMSYSNTKYTYMCQ